MKISRSLSLGWMFVVLTSFQLFASDVAITIDDFRLNDDPLQTATEKDANILAVLSKHRLKAALFVIGSEIERPLTKQRMMKWDDAGHVVGNHTYTHPNYGKVTFDSFSEEFLKTHALIKDLQHFVPLFRFPQLFEGESAEKRDRMRAFLTTNKYKNGHVTIDASDWYVNQRLLARLQKKPKADLKSYRDFYLKHLWERSQYYDELAKRVWGKPVRHTLLIHHNLLNALFLEDVIAMYRRNSWKIIDAPTAFSDPVFDEQPKNVPAGQSLIWALAKVSGKYESILRYPGEDARYEKDEMDRLGL